MSVFCTSQLFTPYHHCKIFWAYDLPLQHSSATRSLQFVSCRLQEQEQLRQQQRQHQHLERMRKGISQQQENVNGLKANQRINEVKYGRPIRRGMQRDVHVCQKSNKVKYGRRIGWGMHRGAHICQRSNMHRMARIISMYHC